jgi:hypothetical protein
MNPTRVRTSVTRTVPAIGMSTAMVAVMTGCIGPDRVEVDDHARVCVSEETAELPPEQWVYLPADQCDDDYDGRRYGGSPLGLAGTFLWMRYNDARLGRVPASAFARTRAMPGTPILGGPYAGSTIGNRVTVSPDSPGGRAGISAGTAKSTGGWGG